MAAKTDLEMLFSLHVDLMKYPDYAGLGFLRVYLTVARECQQMTPRCQQFVTPRGAADSRVVLP
jgi:hypothetical protein